MNININFNEICGKIKPMHGIGQPPLHGLSQEGFEYIRDAGIPYSRLHDVGVPFGNNMFVDIPNIFRDFDADETAEESYDFAFTDWLIESLISHGCEPIFRLGVTIENYHFIKAYRIFPPKDFEKWARICEHIIMHYNEGWANGFHYNITYWEIWNEPDNGRDNSENQMWHGTKEEYFRLYETASKHLKKRFGDSIKVGGYASCGFRHILSDPKKFGFDREASDDVCFSKDRSKNFIAFFEDFFIYIKETRSPIDFFSWHSYLSADETVMCAEYLDRRLDEFGYADLETQLNEWNTSCHDMGNPVLAAEIATNERGTALAGAKVASMMCAMQNTKTQILCYYDSGLSVLVYSGMFNPMNRKPFPVYYAHKAFNELYKLGNRAECELFGDNHDGLYMLAAYNDDKKAVLISNISDEDIRIESNLDSSLSVYAVDDTHMLEKTDADPSDFVAASGTFYLICNTLD